MVVVDVVVVAAATDAAGVCSKCGSGIRVTVAAAAAQRPAAALAALR